MDAPGNPKLSLLKVAIKTGNQKLITNINTPQEDEPDPADVLIADVKKHVDTEGCLPTPEQIPGLQELEAVEPLTNNEIRSALAQHNNQVMSRDIASVNESERLRLQSEGGSAAAIRKIIEEFSRKREDILETNKPSGNSATIKDRIITYLEGRPGGTASFSAIKTKLNLSSSHLANIVHRDAQSRPRTLLSHGSKKDRKLTLNLPTEDTFASPDTPPPPDIDVSAMVPPVWANVLEPPSYAIPEPPYVVFQAPGDGGKTGALISIAIHSASQGRKTLYQHFEGTEHGIIRRMAQQHAGKLFQSTAEAAKYFWDCPLSKFLKIRHMSNRRLIEDQCEMFVEEGFETVILDYLTGAYYSSHVAAVAGGSPYEPIVQAIHTQLSRRGIFFFTAVQDSGNEKTPSTWFRAANIQLESIETERIEENGDELYRTTWAIRKNKIGNSIRGDHYDVFTDPQTLRYVKSQKLSKEEKQEREDAKRNRKKKTAKKQEKSKDDFDEDEDNEVCDF